MKCLLIYSPFALCGKIEKKLPDIVARLSEKFVVDTVKTQFKLHATELAKNACGKYDILVVAGGDGLIYEAINGIANQQNAPTLALLPFGTTNDAAHSLKIPVKLNKALDAILKGTTRQIDCFETDNFFASYAICAGKFTKSTYTTKQKAKKKFKWFAYFFEVLKNLFEKSHFDFEVRLDEQLLPHKFAFILFVNSRSVAGFRLNKKANLEDGKFDAVLFKYEKDFLKSFIRYINLIRMFLFGIGSLKHSKQVVISKAKTATVYNNSLSDFNVDGEFSKAQKELNVGMVNKGITIIVT